MVSICLKRKATEEPLFGIFWTFCLVAHVFNGQDGHCSIQNERDVFFFSIAIMKRNMTL